MIVLFGIAVLATLASGLFTLHAMFGTEKRTAVTLAVVVSILIWWLGMSHV
jgi:uncharacterized membrane protein (DUF441 family)